MADHTILCPACNGKLRVPDDQMGQPVQCPLCRVVFTAPPRPVPATTAIKPASPAKEPPPQPKPEPAEKPGEKPKPPEREPAVSPAGDAVAAEPEPMLDVRRMLLLPGMGLLICGVLGFFQCAVHIKDTLLNGPEGMKELAEARLPAWFQPQPSAQELFVGDLLLWSIFLALSTGMIVGGVQILRLRSYWLAIVGSILGMVNLVSFCFSAPLGVWSLMVLRLPEVRAAFDAMASDEPKEPEP
jgi:hypothetical protein